MWKDGEQVNITIKYLNLIFSIFLTACQSNYPRFLFSSPKRLDMSFPYFLVQNHDRRIHPHSILDENYNISLRIYSTPYLSKKIVHLELESFEKRDRRNNTVQRKSE